MQGKHTGTIRGLSIATIALSVVGLLGCLFCGAILGMMGSVFNESMMAALSQELMYDYGYGYGYDPLLVNGVDSIIGLTIGIIVILLVWEAITCIVTLIGGILGVRNADNPAKLGSVFGWSIAGAAAALLGGRFITMVLLIIVAVLSKKTQDAASVAHWQNVAAQQAQPYGHNVYAQAAPAPQAYAPAPQPVAYQQTYGGQPAAQPVAQPVVQPMAQPVAQPAAQQPAYVEPQPVVAEPVAAAEPEVIQAEAAVEAPVVTPVAEAPAVEAQPVANDEKPEKADQA